MKRKVIFPSCLEYLLAIIEYGSFTRAAEVLHVSQPALSQQIKHLEESLGVLLLNRTGNVIRLTDAGEVYFRHARRARAELNTGMRAVYEAQDMSRGSLRLGWTPVTDHLTCPLLISFNNLYPGITLSTLEMPQDDIESAVIEDYIDIGIVFCNPSSIESLSRKFDTELLFKEEFCLAVANSHPRFEHLQQINAQVLEQVSLILLNQNFAMRRHIDRFCQELDIMPGVAMETNSLGMIIKIVQAGQMATVLPRTIARRQCGLDSIAISPELPSEAITIICRRNGYKSQACRAFTALAMDWAARRAEVVSGPELRPRVLSECPLSR